MDGFYTESAVARTSTPPPPAELLRLEFGRDVPARVVRWNAYLTAARLDLPVPPGRQPVFPGNLSGGGRWWARCRAESPWERLLQLGSDAMALGLGLDCEPVERQLRVFARGNERGPAHYKGERYEGRLSWARRKLGAEALQWDHERRRWGAAASEKGVEARRKQAYERKERALRLRAEGLTKAETARRMGVGVRQVQRYWNEPEPVWWEEVGERVRRDREARARYWRERRESFRVLREAARQDRIRGLEDRLRVAGIRESLIQRAKRGERFRRVRGGGDITVRTPICISTRVVQGGVSTNEERRTGVDPPIGGGGERKRARRPPPAGQSERKFPPPSGRTWLVPVHCWAEGCEGRATMPAAEAVQLRSWYCNEHRERASAATGRA